MREGNYKISRLNIFCIIMMTVAIVLFKFMIVQAADSNAIESVKVGKDYSETIYNQNEQIIKYFYSSIDYNDNDEHEFDSCKKYTLNVDRTGFYLFNYNTEYKHNWEYFIILNENNICAPFWTQEQYSFSDSGNQVEDTEYKYYVFLESGKNYNIFINNNTADNYLFNIEYSGNEIEKVDTWKENGKIMSSRKTKVTAEGDLIISGNGSDVIEMGALFNGTFFLQDLIKSIKFQGNYYMLWTTGIPLHIECPYVENIEFDSSFKYINDEVFYGLNKLKKLEFYCEPPKVIGMDEAFDLLYKEHKGWNAGYEKVKGKVFNCIEEVEAHYPAGCKAWSSDVCKNYGGNIKWVADSNLFTDVSPDYWFYDGVQYVNQNKLMTGVGNGAFGPNKATSRAMLATILYRMDGEKKVDEKAAFSDVSSSQYYADAVAWAVKNGIMTGRNNEKFAPNDKATRQELTSAMYQYAKYLGKDVSKQAELSKYKDASMLSSYGEDAREAFAWAVENGIVSGTSDTQLSPNGNASRAQFAVILKRFAENIK